MNINTVKNYIDQIQINIDSILFYNLVNECDSQDYIHLSLHKLILVDY